MNCVILLVLAAAPAALDEQADATILQQAETAFAQGLRARAQPEEARSYFKQAAESFVLLHRRGVKNAAFYHRLGSAYLLSGDLPHAILAYRMGLQCAPSDPPLQRSLEFARSRVAYAEAGNFGRPPGEERPPWLPHVPLPWQLLAALAFYGAAWIAFTRWRMTRQRRLLLIAAFAGAIAALVIAAFWVAVWQSRQDVLHPVVVIGDDGVLLRRGNGFLYPRRYDTPLNRGVEARLLYARGDWLQIELAGGEVGWIPAAYAFRSLE